MVVRDGKHAIAALSAAVHAMSLALGSWGFAWFVGSQVSRALIGANRQVEAITDLRRDTRKTYVTLLETALKAEPAPASLEADLSRLEVQARTLADGAPRDGQVARLTRLIGEWSATARAARVPAREDVVDRLRPRLDEIDRVVVDLLARAEEEIRISRA